MANYFQKILLFLSIFLNVCTGAGHAADRTLFSMEELQWLSEHSTLSMVVNGTPSPISFWNGPPPRGKILQGQTSPESVRRPLPPPPRRGPGLNLPMGPPPRHRGTFNPPPRPRDAFGAPARQQGRYNPEQPDAALMPVADDEKQYFQGLAADYLKEVTELTGITFETTYFSANNMRAAFDALDSEMVDLIPSIKCTVPKVSTVHLSTPYLRTPIVVVMRADAGTLDDISRLDPMNVAGLLSVPPMLQALGLHYRVQQVSPFEGLHGVATGKFDAFLGEQATIAHELLQNPETNVAIVGELPSSSEFCIAASSRMAEFIPIFDKAVAAIPQEKIAAIERKWFGGQEAIKEPTAQKSWLAGLLGSAALLLGGLGLFYYRRRLQGIRKGIAALEPHLLCAHIDQNITITGVTEALCKATGYAENDLMGKSLQVLGAPPVGGKARLAQLLDTVEQGQTWEGEVKLSRKDGSELWTDVIISPSRRKNDTIGYSIIYQDASRRKHYETLAIRDELTGLYNRRHFNSLAPDLLRKAARDNRQLGLFLLDVDNFKKYNDTYGHPAGDDVLAAIGRTLKHLLKRDDDLSFRLGGEEFAMAAFFATREDVVATARKILGSVKNLDIEHRSNPPGIVTVSLGVALTSGSDDKNIDDLYKRADNCLYKAKKTGRNKCVM